MELALPSRLSDCLICFCVYCSTRNKFFLTRWTGEKFITLSDGKQKTLSTKTLSRKATSCSTKVRVTSVKYSIFNKKNFHQLLVISWIILSQSGLVVRSVRIYHSNKLFFDSSHLQAKANDGRTFISSWRVTMPSSFTLRVRREPPNPKGWST